ncbi:MAG: right-handed parallel beta-helix repeat-containing protein, partial [bacterium]
LRLGPHTSDLLVVDNDFDEIAGPALLVDPHDHWSDYGLIFVKNRLRATKVRRDLPFLQLLAGAEGIRLAENAIEGPGASATRESAAGVEVRGGGTMSTRRLEILLNRIHGTTGPGIAAFQCGPGLLAAGNQLVACGSESLGGVDVVACHGALVEDNEIASPPGPGIRAQDCSSSHLHGNEVVGSDSAARGGSVGVLVEGGGTRRLRVTDNRISGVRGEGLRVGAAHGLRLVGNEIQDCGEGIRVVSATNLLLVGNDCRDNGRGGIRVEGKVRRGLVALNHAILNGGPDLVVRGRGVRCHANKVDKAGSEPETAAAEGSVSP